MSTFPGVSRRRFFHMVGGGIVVFVSLGPTAVFAQEGANRLFVYPKDYNAYLVIGKNGRVAVFSGKIEMGQGVLTSQAQMVAEELGVSLASIDMVLGDTDKCPADMGTFGSLTTRMFGPVLRAAAAQARVELVALAAQKLGAAPDSLLVEHGTVFVAGQPRRRVSYGELSRGAKIVRTVQSDAIPRSASEFQVMGASPQRLDGLEKVTGAAKYAADIRVPGMLYARLLRPPTHGATLLQLDTSGVEHLPGITLINHDGLVAVLHTDPEAAEDALGRIKTLWQGSATKVDPESIHERLVSQAATLKTLAERGNVARVRANVKHVFEATYKKGYVAHAALEPHAAIAQIRDGRATVWASTQTPFPTRDKIAKALGWDPMQVRVITPFVGGGFGGKSADGQAIEAARLAQITGKPVQVAWSRSEEFFNDTFDPASVVKIVSGIETSGRIALWDSVVYSAGERGAVACYDIPNALFRSSGGASYGPPGPQASLHPFAIGPWRAPGANMNVFAIESQIDMMASAVGEDPLAFRLRNLTDSRMRRVLQAAADAFGWQPAAAPSKRGVGMACNIDAGTYVATMAEIKVDAVSGRVQVIRMVCAQDMGISVNPEGAKMQIEGGITMGLGYTLAEELRFLGGDILDRNFGTYEIPRFSWVPRIDAVLVKNDDLAPQGGGEPPITTTGAVIANAVFDATGARLYRLPMTADRIRLAIDALSANCSKSFSTPA
ncbi:MAG: molybdopterin cofactor-binding domain-containing protein [Steroidobacteraceae bacterium]